MPLRGLFRSPFTRPRKERREISASRSSWARNSGDRRSCPVRTVVATLLFLVQGLEVLLHLGLEVSRHLLARDRFLHHLAVLAEDAQVLQPRGHVRASPDHVRVERVLLAGAGFSLHAHVVRRGAQPLGRVALCVRAPALAGEHALSLGEVPLVAGAARLTSALAAPLAAPAIALAAAAEALAVASLLVHRAHLGERAFHGLERLVGLAALERLHALRHIAAPVVLPSALAAEPLHLVQQLAQLLGRDLARIEPPREGLGLLEDDLGLPLGVVLLQVGQAVDLLQHSQPLVAPLQERIEVGSLSAERRVLERRGEIAGLARPARTHPRNQIALLHIGALDRISPGRRRAFGGLEVAGPFGWLLLLVLR